MWSWIFNPIITRTILPNSRFCLLCKWFTFWFYLLLCIIWTPKSFQFFPVFCPEGTPRWSPALAPCCRHCPPPRREASPLVWPRESACQLSSVNRCSATVPLTPCSVHSSCSVNVSRDRIPKCTHLSLCIILSWFSQSSSKVGLPDKIQDA